jgi:hypothetical protein
MARAKPVPTVPPVVSSVLDLRPEHLIVSFPFGTTVCPVFAYLTSDGEAIDLSGYAVVCVLPDVEYPLGQGLEIIKTDVVYNGNAVTTTAVQLNIQVPKSCPFSIKLTSPFGAVTTMFTGQFEVTP